VFLGGQTKIDPSLLAEAVALVSSANDSMAGGESYSLRGLDLVNILDTLICG
jgi:hypothetical protein